jgi:hypothetical protein
MAVQCLPGEVSTYYHSLMKGPKPEPEWLTPIPVFNWPPPIDVAIPNRFALWDRGSEAYEAVSGTRTRS